MRAYYTNSGSAWREEIQEFEAKKMQMNRDGALESLMGLDFKAVELDLRLVSLGDSKDEKLKNGNEKSEPLKINTKGRKTSSTSKPSSAPSPSTPKSTSKLSSRSSSRSQLRNQYQRARTLSSSKSKSKTREILKSLTDGYFGGVRNENENQSSLGVRNDRRDLEGIKRNEKINSNILKVLTTLMESQVLRSNLTDQLSTKLPHLQLQ